MDSSVRSQQEARGLFAPSIFISVCALICIKHLCGAAAVAWQRRPPSCEGPGWTLQLAQTHLHSLVFERAATRKVGLLNMIQGIFHQLHQKSTIQSLPLQPKGSWESGRSVLSSKCVSDVERSRDGGSPSAVGVAVGTDLTVAPCSGRGQGAASG